MLSIFVNHMAPLTRIAITRDGRLDRFVLDRGDGEASVGSIYLARVTKVGAGIGAAFVDWNHGKRKVSGFLNRGDLPKSSLFHAQTGVDSLLKEGRRLLVQVKTPAYEDKLARVTADLKLVGFFCIYLPLAEGVIFSKRFAGDRKSFKKEFAEMAASGGWLVRSGAEQVTWETVAAEARALVARFQTISREAESGPTRLLHREQPLWQCLGDAWKDGLHAIHIDDGPLFEEVRQETEARAPLLLPLMKRHTGPYPLFDVYDLEGEIEKATASHLWLPSGGSLVFHQTPAMMTVDVNSGKNTRTRGSASAAMKANLEAAREIPRQLRIRNQAGLVVIDFISLGKRGDWKRVNDTLHAELAKDHARIEWLPINRLGLAHIARERKGPALGHLIHRACPECGGSGRVDRLEHVALAVQRQLLRQAPGLRSETLIVKCGAELAAYLLKNHRLLFDNIETLHGCRIQVKNEDAIPARGFRVDL